MADDTPFVPAIDTSRPHSARIYDYFLGGDANFPIDRQVAEDAEAKFEGFRMISQQVRACMIRTIHALSNMGITQFLDLGSGLPTAENVHQAAQRINPDARVVYVDNDPIVLAHVRALLDENAQTSYLHADVVDVDRVLEHASRLLDWERPTAVLASATMHYIKDKDAYDLLDRYTRHLPPGSAVAVIQFTHEGTSDEVLDIVTGAGLGYQPRTFREIASLAPKGWEIIPPGVVEPHVWRAQEVEAQPRMRHLAFVARKP